MAKLTAKEAEEIRAASGTQQEIASKYGVSRATVWYIRSGRHWKATARP